MKKRFVFLLIVFLIPLFAISTSAFNTGTGVKICGVSYPCGARDGVCPQDYRQDTSTSSVTFSQVMCGGMGAGGSLTGQEPNTKQIVIDCNDCLRKHTIKKLCSGVDVRSCRFCLNSAKCPSASTIERCPFNAPCTALRYMLRRSAVSGIVNLRYSPNIDPDKCGACLKSGACTASSHICSGYWCDVANGGKVCPDGEKWDFLLGDCIESSNCGQSCLYSTLDINYWTSPHCFYPTGRQPPESSCCSVTYGTQTTDWQNIERY